MYPYLSGKLSLKLEDSTSEFSPIFGSSSTPKTGIRFLLQWRERLLRIDLRPNHSLEIMYIELLPCIAYLAPEVERIDRTIHWNITIQWVTQRVLVEFTRWLVSYLEIALSRLWTSGSLNSTELEFLKRDLTSNTLYSVAK